MNLNQPFSLIRKQESNNIIYASGDILKLDNIADIPSKKSNKDSIIDSVSILPFSQIKEKNYKVIDANEKILTIDVKEKEIFTINEFRAFVEDLSLSKEIELEENINYVLDEKDYGQIIEDIIEKEIGNGEGANFVIPRVGKAKIKDFKVEKLLHLYNEILENESGAYWTFLFFDGEKYFIGASPERNVYVKNSRVKMNPISGTYRKKYDSVLDLEKYKQEFLNFLQDEKEVNELFMVLDEELKMMSRICSNGGMIIGPLLKEMKKLIHTEYLLSGETTLDIREVLKESMHAPTVTGSPIENACNIIAKYETDSRGYYSSNIAMIGRENGEEFLDSCITIRTLEIESDGSITFKAGGTLVRDSKVEDEIQETKYKISGMLDILRGKKTNYLSLQDFYKNDDDIAEVLQTRNQNLSNFWFFSHENLNENRPFLNKSAVLIHNEDDFTYMIEHMLRTLGFEVKTISYLNFEYEENSNKDLIIVGPGPGNPMDNSAKMKKNMLIISKLRENKQPFLAICLGHQLLCKSLNLTLAKKDVPLQGVQKKIEFFDKKYKVGYYNTFTGIFEKDMDNVTISYDKDSKEIHGLKAQFFQSYQFHVESVLTQSGYSILKDSLSDILKA